MSNMPDWGAYQAKARSYSSYADGTGLERQSDHVHCAALGLAGESSEAVEYISGVAFGSMAANMLPKIQAELGDVLWYVAELAAAFGISLEALAIIEAQIVPSFPTYGIHHAIQLYTDLTIWSGKAVDYTKKVVHHKHQIDIDKMVDLLSRTLHAVIELAHTHGFAMSEVAQGNLDKLAARYPEGRFTTARSIHRAPE